MQAKERVIWHISILMLLEQFRLGDPNCWRIVVNYNPILVHWATTVGFMIWDSTDQLTMSLVNPPYGEMTTDQKNSWLDAEILAKSILFAGSLSSEDIRNPLLGVTK
jgi:hypothetical protein